MGQRDTGNNDLPASKRQKDAFHSIKVIAEESVST